MAQVHDADEAVGRRRNPDRLNGGGTLGPVPNGTGVPHFSARTRSITGRMSADFSGGENLLNEADGRLASPLDALLALRPIWDTAVPLSSPHARQVIG